MENIDNDSEEIPIRWCSLIDGDDDDDETKIDENTHFKLDYEDTLDTNAILMEIKHVIHHADHSISLRKQDIILTNRLLKKSISPDKSTAKRKKVTHDESARKLIINFL